MSKPVHIISLGAGVQSSTMALMAAAGEITPMPVAAVFADTQAEPASVYKWLDWLEKQLPFPVHRVSRGSLTDVSLRVRNKKDGSGKWVKSLIPAFIANPDGTRGIMGRACTFDYKVIQLEKESRKVVSKSALLEWRRKHESALTELRNWSARCVVCKRENLPRPPKPLDAWNECQSDAIVIQWIGISLDESHRMKPARLPWIRHRWPLIDLRMKRHDCLRWVEAHNFPRPPRSACVYCPFHSDAEWRRMRDNEPNEFDRAVRFERDLQTAKAQTDNRKGVPFLHSSLRLLSDVDFSTASDRGQGDLFGNECEGMCGV